MIRKSYLAILFAIVWLSVPVAQASDYYVSPSGNNSNPGTSPAKAWKTISKVNGATFKAGDNIFFESGKTFRGGLKLDARDGGTAENPITVGSYGARQATINSGGRHGLYAKNCAGFIIRDLNFVGSGRTDTRGGSGIYFFTNLMGGVKPEYVRIDNVEVSGYRQTGILIGGSRKSNSGFKDVRITNAEVHDNGDKGISSSGSKPPGDWPHRDIYVGNCRVYDNAGFSDPTSWGHHGNGIVLSAVDGAVIEFCEVHNNGWLCDTKGGGPVGIWAYDANNVIIQFCEAHHNKTSGGDGGGFDLDGGCVNSVMQYNYSHDNHGAGYLICQYSGAREFKNNVCRYNITENDGIACAYPMGAIHFYSSGSSGGIQDTQVYNNTVYVTSATRGAGIEIDTGYIYNTRIYNNIIFTAPGKCVVDANITSGRWSFKGNCYWSSGAPLEIVWGDATYTSLDAWRSATGQERLGDSPWESSVRSPEDLRTDVGFEVDPKLTNPGGGGTIGDPHLLSTLDAYQLQESSPLIDAGLDLRAVFGIEPGKHDFYRKTLPRGVKLNIGAAE